MRDSIKKSIAMAYVIISVAIMLFAFASLFTIGTENAFPLTVYIILYFLVLIIMLTQDRCFKWANEWTFDEGLEDRLRQRYREIHNIDKNNRNED